MSRFEIQFAPFRYLSNQSTIRWSKFLLVFALAEAMTFFRIDQESTVFPFF